MHNTELHFKNRWYQYATTYIRGYAFYKGNLLKEEELAEFFSGKPLSEVTSLLQQANGSFSLVSIVDDALVAVVDQIRSIPIFYSIAEDKNYLSDDPYWILEHFDDKTYDEVSMAEFLLSKYVLGTDTLHPQIKQIQAGEIITITGGSRHPSAIAERYYVLPRSKQLEISEDTLLDELHEVLTRTFDRLIKSVNGRTIVVPLSGGYDSRLIIITLKRIGYENVICYSYGRDDYDEVKISHDVAQSVGYQWVFVPYNNERWHQWFNTPEMKVYMEYSDGLSSSIRIPDWPAVWELKKLKIIPDDSVFVPGYALDILAGSHIPFELIAARKINEDSLINYIFRRYFNQWNLEKVYSLFNWKIPAIQIEKE